jgi:soluble lytic murein transglycosylase-like protein
MQNPELAAALRKRQEGSALMRQGMDASPIQSPWQGVSRLAQALLGGYEARKGDEEITGTAEKRRKMAAELMAPYSPGGAAPAGAVDAAPAPAPQAPIPAAGSPDLMGLVAPIAQKYGVPLGLAMALLRQESGGNPGAVGDGGKSVGLGQIQDATARQPGYGVAPMDPAQRTDPAANVDFAMRYLKAKGAALGATDLNDPAQQAIALKAYNGGGDPNYVQNVQGRMPPPAVQPPGGAPPRTVGSQDMGEAQFYENKAMQAQAAGMHQEAALLMQRAQRAQAAALARQPQPTEIERVAAAAGLQPGSPEYQRLMRDYVNKKGAGVQVTVAPNPPTDHRAVYDQDGRLTHYEVIPGSATDRKLADAAKKEEGRATSTIRSGNIVVEDIDRTMAAVDKAFLPATGVGASTLAGIPGTAAHDVSKLLDGIRANIGFDKLQQMRESSPTGGALGQVSEKENELLQSVFGSLAQSQSPQQFKENLKRLKTVYMDIIHGVGKWKEVAPAEPDATPTRGQGGGWSIRPAN